jgi:hypothetical protein
MVPRKRPASAWQRIDGEMVVLQQDAGQLAGLNAVGARIWELIDGVRSVEDIVVMVAAEYPGAGGAARADIEAFLSALVAAKLVELP